MEHEDHGPAGLLAEHLRDCTPAAAAIVAGGNADGIVAGLVAAGWVLHERVDYVLGKRIRFLSPPGGGSGA